MEQKVFEPYVFHSPATQKKGVRVTVVGEIADGVLNIAVSRCGEEDRFVFNKNEGRYNALLRLANGNIFTSVPCEKPSLAKFIAVAKVVSDIVINHSTIMKATLEGTEKTVVFYSYKVV